MVFIWLMRESFFCPYLFKTPPRAQGMRTSHSWISSSFESIASPPLKSTRLPVVSLWLRRASMSRPSGFLTAPVMSLTATTFPPFSWISLAAHVPTFPKPCHTPSISLNIFILIPRGWAETTSCNISFVLADISQFFYSHSQINTTLSFRFEVSFTWTTNVNPLIDLPYSARRASVA